MNEDTILITRVIAAFSWHIIGIMFLIQSISFIIVKMYYIAGSFLIVFAICEGLAFSRKKDVELAEKEDFNSIKEEIMKGGEDEKSI